MLMQRKDAYPAERYSTGDAKGIGYTLNGHAGSKGRAMPFDDYIERIKFFNEKATKLQRLSFTQSILTEAPEVTASFLFEEASVEIQTTTPHEESIDAFLYTFRFFIINNEETSFRKMAKMYEQLPIAEEKKEKLRSARNNLNTWLDSKSNFAVNGEALTHRRIMNTFIYGGLGHANDKNKVQEYKMWTATPIIHFLKVEFIYTTANIFKMIWYFRSLHEDILEELERSIRDSNEA
jgi:hypothetical protein